MPIPSHRGDLNVKPGLKGLDPLGYKTMSVLENSQENHLTEF